MDEESNGKMRKKQPMPKTAADLQGRKHFRDKTAERMNNLIGGGKI